MKEIIKSEWQYFKIVRKTWLMQNVAIAILLSISLFFTFLLPVCSSRYMLYCAFGLLSGSIGFLGPLYYGEIASDKTKMFADFRNKMCLGVTKRMFLSVRTVFFGIELVILLLMATIPQLPLSLLVKKCVFTENGLYYIILVYAILMMDAVINLYYYGSNIMFYGIKGGLIGGFMSGFVSNARETKFSQNAKGLLILIGVLTIIYLVSFLVKYLLALREEKIS